MEVRSGLALVHAKGVVSSHRLILEKISLLNIVSDFGFSLRVV